MLLFDLDADDPQGSRLGPQLAHVLGVPLAPHEARRFADGESKLRPLVDPHGADTVVLTSLHGSPQSSPHDRLVHLLMFLATLREHGATRITAVIPYLAYARKDRGTKPFDPIASRYMAQLIEAVGTDRVVVLEVHNLSALQNAFRIPTVHVPVHPIFDAVLEPWLDDTPLTVVSPDPGGVKRAQLWREHLEARLRRPVGFAMIDKRRSAGVVSSFDLVAGEVAGSTALVFDDLIASGDTVRRAALALRGQGARRVLAFAAHGLFMPPAAELLADPALDAVVVSDSMPPFRVPPDGALAKRLTVVSAAPLLAQAVLDPTRASLRSA